MAEEERGTITGIIIDIDATRDKCSWWIIGWSICGHCHAYDPPAS
jgi:hypothetical protein